MKKENMQSFEMNLPHLIATILFSLILGTNAFSYKEAKNWSKQYPDCKGKNQSPVIVKPTGIKGFDSIFQKLKPIGFNQLPKKLTMKNTGHHVEIKAEWSGETPSVTGGPLHGKYVFEKVTFHWARKTWNELFAVVYSEALSQDMDMHMFFYNTDFKSFEKAETQKGGLAVYKIGLKSGYDNPDHLLDKVEKNLYKVRSINSKTEIPAFHLLGLVDAVPVPFLYYDGSLDYPPCSESVTWFIDDSGSAITDGLLKEFRKIKLAEGDVSNVRPVQKLNKRKIQMVYNEDGYTHFRPDSNK